jgi:hypothetical protein
VDPDLEMQERPQSPEASTVKGADGMISAVRTENGGHTMAVSLPGWRSAYRSFTYRVRWNGRRLKSGRFSILRIHSRSRRFWRGSDEFFNYCINERRRIWREDGRYYCVFPGGTDTVVRFG